MSNKIKGKDNKPKGEVDQVTGTETTGHEWDGLKELDTPAPRWWLIVWMISIVFSIGYMFAYPAWPTIKGHTKGLFGWTQYTKLKAEQKEITGRQGVYLQKFHTASFDQIKTDPALYEFARAGVHALDDFLTDVVVEFRQDVGQGVGGNPRNDLLAVIFRQEAQQVGDIGIM